MARVRLKEWKNGRYQPQWTVRIIWYQAGYNDPTDIRLQMEDCERKVNYYPQSKEEADAVWNMFRDGAPPKGVQRQYVYDLLTIVKRNYPHTQFQQEPNNG